MYPCSEFCNRPEKLKPLVLFCSRKGTTFFNLIFLCKTKLKTLAHDTSTIFSYEGANITFQNGANVMVECNSNGSFFGTSNLHVVKNSSSKRVFICPSKSKPQKSGLNDYQDIDASGGLTNELYGGLVVTVRGGANPGTWMHQDVALEFARWLSHVCHLDKRPHQGTTHHRSNHREQR